MIPEMIKIFDKLCIFNDYLFDEEPHVYTYKGEKVSLSATRLIEEYSNPFDKEKLAPLCARKEGITTEEMLKKWDKGNLISQIKGTHLHAYMENKTANKLYRYPKDEVIKAVGYDIFEKINDISLWDNLTKMMDEFQKDIQGKMIPIRSELIIGDPDFDIAGAIDQIYFNKKTNSIEIWDWKTNKEIKFKGYEDKKTKKTQKMLDFLNHLDDCNFIHYSLQLNIYKYVLEKMTGLKIGACRIVWFNERNDKYQVFTCRDLSQEAKQILEHRRVK